MENHGKDKLKKYYKLWKWRIALFLIMTCPLFVSCVALMPMHNTQYSTAPKKNIQHSNEVVVGNGTKIINNELAKGVTINLLLLLPENNFIDNCFDTRSDKQIKGEINIITADQAAFALRWHGDKTNFTVVNRSVVDEIFKEYKTQLSDVYAEEGIVKIGNMVGANYIYLYNFRRDCMPPDKVRDTITRELINIETNTIEAVDEVVIIETFNSQQQKWIVTEEIYNGRKTFIDEKTGEMYYL